MSITKFMLVMMRYGVRRLGAFEMSHLPASFDDRIVNVVLEETGVDPADLFGPSRKRDVAIARWLCYLLMREFLPWMSYPDIARSMMRPNHSSVVTGVHAALERLERDRWFEDLYRRCRDHAMPPAYVEFRGGPAVSGKQAKGFMRMLRYSGVIRGFVRK